MTKLTDTQPSNLNQLNIVSFEVNFARLPNVQYFCQRVNIPAVILGDTFQPMPFLNLPVEGDTLSFEAMNLSFILDEDMQNYTEIYNWLTALGFPRDYEQFKTLKPASEASQYLSMFSDVNIILNTNKSNPNYKITFNDCFPTSLSSVQFDTSVSALEPIIVDATFNFKGMFNIEKFT